MGDDHYIETPFDVLLSTLKDAHEPLSAGRLALMCGMREKDVVKWLHVLEKDGQVRIDNRFNGIYISWTGNDEDKKISPQVSPSAIEVGRRASFEFDVKLAHQREDDTSSTEAAKEKRTAVPLAPKSAVDVGDSHIVGVERLMRNIQESRSREEENLIDAIKRESRESEDTVATETESTSDFERMPLEEKEEDSPDSALEIEAEARKAVPDVSERESWRKEIEGESAARRSKRSGMEGIEGKSAIGRKGGEDAGSLYEGESSEEGSPRVRVGVPMKGAIRPKFRYAGVKPVKIAKMKKPAPVEVTGVTLQFSERIERQMKRIERQARDIDALRQEKEKLLSEHYIPLQHRLESELETISDRVLHVQSKVANLQKNAADLPSKISSVEKVQISSIKAHGEMRRAYDEACALLEESGIQLAEEREKMELLLEQSREELSRHSAMSGELHNTMERIEEMENDAASQVASARAALAEQAERLASAETHASGLRELRSEIGESITEMKREVASAKRVLSDLERQMGEMRRIEEYTNGIRKDYDARMLEIDDYIRNGNREFETLRESVEANFVRRYLRELRSLTESYSFEFGQARKMEEGIDARISDERAKLEQLFEEGKKISYLFETQSRAPENSEKFEKRAETFTALSEISSNRSQVAQMIAQVIGGRSESLPKRAVIAANEKKTDTPEIEPIGITKILANAKKAKAPRVKQASKAKKKAKAPKMKKAKMSKKIDGRKKR